MTWKVINGNNIDILKQYPDNHFDSIVTDPPYGIEFLGKDWDKNTGAMETWQECLRVLKPGGYLLAFSAARTYHHLATNIEMAGFEIKDQLMWIYSSGFPKAQDIGKAIQKRQGVEERQPYKDGGNNKLNDYCQDGGDPERFTKSANTGTIVPTSPEAKQWAGWKTALKPAHEPIVMARKPFKGSCVDNVMEWGTGALNIDESRISVSNDDMKNYVNNLNGNMRSTLQDGDNIGMFDNKTGFKNRKIETTEDDVLGRYPSNVMGEITEYQKFFFNPEPDKPAHEPIVMARKPFKGSCVDNVMEWGTGALNIDESRVPFAENDDERIGKGYQHQASAAVMPGQSKKGMGHQQSLYSSDEGRYPSNVLGEIPEYQRFYYCPKVSRAERHAGFEQKNIPAPFGDVKGAYVDGDRMAKVADDTQYASSGNNHPTVKPVELMKYLIRLVTPKGGIVLDPFNGSGSTGMGAVELGMSYVGCELDPNYVEIANKRIAAWEKKFDNPINNLFDIDE